MGYWITLNLVDLGYAKSARNAVNADVAAWPKRRNANLRIFLSNVRLGPGGGQELRTRWEGVFPGYSTAAGIGVDWSRPGTPLHETWNRPRMTRCPVVFTNAKSESHPR